MSQQYYDNKENLQRRVEAGGLGNPAEVMLERLTTADLAVETLRNCAQIMRIEYNRRVMVQNVEAERAAVQIKAETISTGEDQQKTTVTYSQNPAPSTLDTKKNAYDTNTTSQSLPSHQDLLNRVYALHEEEAAQ